MKYDSLFFLGIWATLLGYAFFLAPPDQPDTIDLIFNLSTGQWQGINPLIIALFNLMGIWPLIYLPLMLADGQEQKIAAWPFAMASFMVGAFAILPYLAFRSGHPTDHASPQRARNWLDRGMTSRWYGLGIALAAVTLLTYGLLVGNWSEFIHQWQTSRFIHVMSLDFCLLWLLFPVLWRADLKRWSGAQARYTWGLVLVPVVGAALCLSLRPFLVPEHPQKVMET
jgi:hypothetical protein